MPRFPQAIMKNSLVELHREQVSCLLPSLYYLAAAGLPAGGDSQEENIDRGGTRWLDEG